MCVCFFYSFNTKIVQAQALKIIHPKINEYEIYYPDVMLIFRIPALCYLPYELLSFNLFPYLNIG